MDADRSLLDGNDDSDSSAKKWRQSQNCTSIIQHLEHAPHDLNEICSTENESAIMACMLVDICHHHGGPTIQKRSILVGITHEGCGASRNCICLLLGHNCRQLWISQCVHKVLIKIHFHSIWKDNLCRVSHCANCHNARLRVNEELRHFKPSWNRK